MTTPHLSRGTKLITPNRITASDAKTKADGSGTTDAPAVLREGQAGQTYLVLRAPFESNDSDDLDVTDVLMERYAGQS